MNKQAIISFLIIIGLIFFLVLMAQDRDLPQSVTSDSEKLSVVTTFLPMFIFTSNVVGNVATVENLLPPGVGPHNYSFAPSDIKKLSKADILVKNGVGLEDWLDGLVNSIGNDELTVIDTSRGISLIEDKDEHGKEDGHGEFNPHIWLDPIKAIGQVENIRDGLILADPSNASIYRANAGSFIRKIRKLDQDLKREIKQFSTKDFISFHSAFVYFANRYGLNQVAVLEEFPGQEPTAKDIVEIINDIKRFNISTIFIEPQFLPKIAQSIAEDEGLQVLVLDPMAIGEFVNDSYELIMRSNLEALKQALKQ